MQKVYRTVSLPMLAFILIFLYPKDSQQKSIQSEYGPLTGIDRINLRIFYRGSLGTNAPDFRGILRYDGKGFLAPRLDSLMVDSRDRDYRLNLMVTLRQYPLEHPEPISRVLVTYAWIESRSERIVGRRRAPEQREEVSIHTVNGLVLWQSQPRITWIEDISDFEVTAQKDIEHHLNKFADDWFRDNMMR